MTITLPTTISFTRKEIKARDFSQLLEFYGTDKLPEGRSLAKLMGTLHFEIKGYSSNSWKAYGHPEVMKFFYELHRVWPHWYFFAELSNDCEAVAMISHSILCERARRRGLRNRTVFSLTELRWKMALYEENASKLASTMQGCGLSTRRLVKRRNQIFYAIV